MNENDKRKKFSGRRKPHSDKLNDPTVNRELIELRINAGYTQKEAAAALHISRPLYTMIELDKRNGKYVMEDAKKLFAQ